MSYLTEADEAERAAYKRMIEQALTKAIEPKWGKGGNDDVEKIADALVISNNYTRAVDALVNKTRTTDTQTGGAPMRADASDADVDAAVVSTTSISLMKQMFVKS